MTLEEIKVLLSQLPDWEIGKKQEESLLSEAVAKECLDGLREIAFEGFALIGDLAAVDSVEGYKILAVRNLARYGVEDDAAAVAELALELDYEDPDYADAFNEDFDWVMAQFGQAAFEPLRNLLSDLSMSESCRLLWACGLKSIAESGVLTDEICDFFEELCRQGALHRSVNAIMLHALAEIRKAEAFEIVKAIYDANVIDVTVCGDWEDLEVAMGLIDERTSPPVNLVELEEKRRADFFRAKLGPVPKGSSPARVLEHFLILYGRPSAASSVAELHALLTCLIISPKMAPPSAIMGIIWDTREASLDFVPSWESIEEGQQFANALKDFYNGIIRDLDRGTYQAIAEEVDLEIEDDEEEEEDGLLFSLENWVEGLCQGVTYLEKLCPSEPLVKQLDEVANELLGRSVGMLAFPEEDLEMVTFEVVDLIQQARASQQRAVRARFSPLSRLTSPANSPAPQGPPMKVGRNDPCPCGSGNKYKRCCAN